MPRFMYVQSHKGKKDREIRLRDCTERTDLQHKKRYCAVSKKWHTQIKSNQQLSRLI